MVVVREKLAHNLRRWEASPSREGADAKLLEIRAEIARHDEVWEVYELFLGHVELIALYPLLQQLPYEQASVTFVREVIDARLSDARGAKQLFDAHRKCVQDLRERLARASDAMGAMRTRRIPLPARAVSIRHLLLTAAAQKDTYPEIKWSTLSAGILGRPPNEVTCSLVESNGNEVWLHRFDKFQYSAEGCDQPSPDEIWAFAPGLEDILRLAASALGDFEPVTFTDPAVFASRKYSAKAYFLRDVLSRLVSYHEWDASTSLKDIVARATTVLINTQVTVKDVDRALARVRQAQHGT
jgi:hypothetical protein